MSATIVSPEYENALELPVEWEAENFRIGLIPLRGSVASLSTDLSRDNSVLLLPITWKELLSRVRAEAVAPKPVQAQQVARFGDVAIDFARMEATRAGRRVEMTRLQFKLLEYFISNPYRVIPRSELLDRVWGFQNYPSTRTVDTFLLKLRRKFEPVPEIPIHFCTVHGSGYKFVP